MSKIYVGNLPFSVTEVEMQWWARTAAVTTLPGWWEGLGAAWAPGPLLSGPSSAVRHAGIGRARTGPDAPTTAEKLVDRGLS